MMQLPRYYGFALLHGSIAVFAYYQKGSSSGFNDPRRFQFRLGAYGRQGVGKKLIPTPGFQRVSARAAAVVAWFIKYIHCFIPVFAGLPAMGEPAYGLAAGQVFLCRTPRYYIQRNNDSART